MALQDPVSFPMPEQPDCNSFGRSLQQASGLVSLIIDEAQELGKLAEESLSDFLDTCRELKESRLLEKGLGGLALVGTESLQAVVLRGGSTSPFNQVGDLYACPPPPPRG